MSDSAEQAYTCPSHQCLQHACKISISEDKPVMYDYWTASLDENVIIGVRENNEKLLVKSEEEYTSPITKIFKVENEYIIITEYSIYITHAKVKTRRIS